MQVQYFRNLAFQSVYSIGKPYWWSLSRYLTDTRKKIITLRSLQYIFNVLLESH